jgi:hypothetical protein
VTLARMFSIAALLALAPLAATAQQQAWREGTVTVIAAGEWSGARTADGQPDVSGHWSNTIGNHNDLTNPQGGDAPEPATRNRDDGNAGNARVRAARAPSRISDPPMVRSRSSPGRERSSRSSLPI